jgi:hypothetical protein
LKENAFMCMLSGILRFHAAKFHTIQIRSQNLANRPWTQIDLNTFKASVFMNWIRIQIELNPHENVVNVNYASYNWAPGYFINATIIVENN